MFGDWTLLAIGVLFCGAALLTMGSDWRTGTVMLAFFGGCTLMFMVTILRKLRERGFRALRVSVEGSRNIEADKTFLISLSTGLLAVGAVIFVVGTTVPWHIRAIGAFMALCGMFLLAAWAGGLLRQYLRFEPEGLVLGLRRFEYRVPWDSIAGIRTMEIADNPLVYLVVPDTAHITVAPPAARRKFVKHLRRNGICIAPAVFGMDTPPLLAALERYARDPQTRAELAPRPDAAGLQALPHARLP